MTRKVIGWEHESAVPSGHRFNSYLQAKDGRLYMDGIDLADLFVGGGEASEALGRVMPSPLEIVYLPLIERKIKEMQEIFDDVRRELEYPGHFHYAYASKANAAEEVVRTTLSAGAHHEMSSTVDVDIARLMVMRGLLPADRFVICNGFKPTGTSYADNIVRFKAEHDNLIPVLEDLNELPPLLNSGQRFEVGLRQKCYGHHKVEDQMDKANSRFGFDLEMIWHAAEQINQSTNLTLKLYHAMVGSQILDEADFVDRLRPPMAIYAKLKKRYPTLSIFDFGGGVPVAMTLDFSFDYRLFARLLLTALLEACRAEDVAPPDVMGEFGRYTTSEHGAHLFKVITAKDNNSLLPWYLIDGSIMTSFPDSWALGEHFIALPLNHLDKPFRRVRLGGMTCDSDDIYPPKKSESPLYLPAESDDLYIGFFSIGAYQEMLGGVRGSKHCVLPEANELIIERDEEGRPTYQVMSGQNATDVLRNLGYVTT